MSKPEWIFVTLRYRINPDNYDDDVDWSDVPKLIKDHIDDVGAREAVYEDSYPTIMEIATESKVWKQFP